MIGAALVNKSFWIHSQLEIEERERKIIIVCYLFGPCAKTALELLWREHARVRLACVLAGHLVQSDRLVQIHIRVITAAEARPFRNTVVPPRLFVVVE